MLLFETCLANAIECCLWQRVPCSCLYEWNGAKLCQDFSCVYCIDATLNGVDYYSSCTADVSPISHCLGVRLFMLCMQSSCSFSIANFITVKFTKDSHDKCKVQLMCIYCSFMFSHGYEININTSPSRLF